jgi:hypothetical protein
MRAKSSSHEAISLMLVDGVFNCGQGIVCNTQPVQGVFISDMDEGCLGGSRFTFLIARLYCLMAGKCARFCVSFLDPCSGGRPEGPFTPALWRR